MYVCMYVIVITYLQVPYADGIYYYCDDIRPEGVVSSQWHVNNIFDVCKHLFCMETKHKHILKRRVFKVFKPLIIERHLDTVSANIWDVALWLCHILYVGIVRPLKQWIEIWHTTKRMGRIIIWKWYGEKRWLVNMNEHYKYIHMYVICAFM